MDEVFDFGIALDRLKAGYKVARSGWNGKGMWLQLSKPDNKANMFSYINTDKPYPTLPFIVMKTAQDQLVPWLASQTDILAEDWSGIDC